MSLYFSRPGSGFYPRSYILQSLHDLEMTDTLNHTHHAGAQLSVEKHSADEVNAQRLLSASPPNFGCLSLLLPFDRSHFVPGNLTYHHTVRLVTRQGHWLDDRATEDELHPWWSEFTVPP